MIAACLLEFLLLGSATAAIAAGLGTAMAYAAVRSAIMAGRWQALPATTAVLVLAALAVLAATGYLLARRALAQPPAAVLRRQQRG